MPGVWEHASALLAVIMFIVFICPAMVSGPDDMAVPPAEDGKEGRARLQALDTDGAGELLVAGYIGNPIYYRSKVRLTRPDGTDLDLKGVGWDGDALYFPIDGGVRAVRWGNRFGFMIDFLHNKAVARLGKGAHGRKLRYPVVEEVEASGMLKGKPAPKRILLTDIFTRLEFTHGHNVLLATGMMRFGSPVQWIVPYAGLGAGFAIPHTEVRFKGEGRAQRTSEYQYAGPAAQMLFGLEFRVGRMSYFLEYKFSYAWIKGALSGDESWKNWNMVGDLWRQFDRWRSGGQPKYGRIGTTLGAHQIIAGAGYRWNASTKP